MLCRSSITFKIIFPRGRSYAAQLRNWIPLKEMRQEWRSRGRCTTVVAKYINGYKCLVSLCGPLIRPHYNRIINSEHREKCCNDLDG